MRTLSEDLGIIGIPRWQSYELFIRRRLFRTLGEISTVSTRYQALLKLFNTIYQMQTAEDTKVLAAKIGDSTRGAQRLMRKLSDLQVGAGLVAFFLLFATAAEVFRHLPDRLFGVVPVDWMKPATPLMAVLAVLAVLVAIGFTAVSTVREYSRRDRAGDGDL